MLSALLMASMCIAQDAQVLVFTKTAGFRHGSVDRGSQAIAELGEGAWTVVRTEDPADFTHGNLSEYQAVVFLNTTLDVLDDQQQDAFEAYLRGGGGWLGIHAAADTEYQWQFYGDELLGGAWFKTHPAVQEATVVVEDAGHPAMVGLPARWQRTDEWYDFRANPRNAVHVLASVDESTYSPRAPMGDHPMAWSIAVGDGTGLYTGGGHTVESFDEPLFRLHLRNALAFVIDDGWIEMIRTGLDGWRPTNGPWANVGAVHLDPDDSLRLSSEPGEGTLFNGPTGRAPDLISTATFGDCAIHLEWMMAKGSNSGIYVQGCYEVQILDSWGVRESAHDDAGGIYQRWDPARGEGQEGYEGRPPRVNAARKPGHWQSFDIVFRAARWNADGEKTQDARFESVHHNGILIHENVALSGPTRGGQPEVPGPGPLRLQGDHGPVAYRSIRVRRLGP